MYQEALQRFRETRANTLKTLAEMAQQDLDARPAPNKWSPGEVLHHLALFDGFFLRDGARLIELARRGRPATIYHSFAEVDVAPPLVPKAFLPLLEMPLALTTQLTPPCLRDVLVRNRLFRIQHPRFATPTPGLGQADLEHQLRDSLAAFVDLYDGNADLDYRRMSLTHPLIGTLNLVEVIEFTVSHEVRHQAQIRDTLARNNAA